MKKTIHLLWLALLTVSLTYAQNDIGDEFSVGDFDFIITSIQDDDIPDSADEVAVKGTSNAAIVDLVIPPTALNTTDPEAPFTYAVTSIAEAAFGVDKPSNKTIITVVLPPSVVTIGKNAFGSTSALTTANLENVVTFGGSTFGQSGITAIDLSSAVSLAGGYDFYWCTALVSVENFNQVTTIGNGAFRRATSLGSLNIPSTVNSIGNQLFRQMSSLTQVQLNWADPANDVVIDQNTNVFGNIDPLVIKFYVPAGTKADYEAIFPWNLALPANIIEGDMPESAVGESFSVAGINFTVTSDDPKEARVSGASTPDGKVAGTKAGITIPATATNPNNSEVYAITSIGGSAFLDDATLTSVVLPTSVTLLSSDAFSGCVNLETINLESVVTIETQNVFFNCPKLTAANLAAATSIGNFAFHTLGDSSLSSISIPSMVTIGGSAFRTSVIPSINIPATVTTIGTRAFMDCMSLTGIQVNWAAADIPVIDAGVFENLTVAGITLYVPVGTSADYAAAAVWQDFTIVEGVLGTNEVEQALGLRLYPNPTHGIVTIKNKNISKIDVTVYDINGRTLLNTTDSRVDISRFAAGLYIFRIKTDAGELVKRILKQ